MGDGATAHITLMRRLCATSPGHPPYGGIHEDNVVPHLMVARVDEGGELEPIVEEVSPAVRSRLPITAQAQSVALLEQGEEGRWGVRAQVTLGADER